MVSSAACKGCGHTGLRRGRPADGHARTRGRVPPPAHGCGRGPRPLAKGPRPAHLPLLLARQLGKVHGVAADADGQVGVPGGREGTGREGQAREANGPTPQVIGSCGDACAHLPPIPGVGLTSQDDSWRPPACRVTAPGGGRGAAGGCRRQSVDLLLGGRAMHARGQPPGQPPNTAGPLLQRPRPRRRPLTLTLMWCPPFWK